MVLERTFSESHVFELCDDKTRAFEPVLSSVTKRSGTTSLAESAGSCRHMKEAEVALNERSCL